MEETFKKIKRILEDPSFKDKDVFMFEQLEKYYAPANMAILELFAEHPSCTQLIWEKISEICFLEVEHKRTSDLQRGKAVNLLRKHQNFLKKNHIDLNESVIPDEILNFQSAGRKFTKVSKLQYPLTGIDIKVSDMLDRKTLEELEEDAILLVAMIRKRKEQLSHPKGVHSFTKRVYTDRVSRKQMIQLRVNLYHNVLDTNGTLLYKNEKTVVEEHLLFKKSDPRSVREVNKKIEEINKKYNMNIQQVS